MKLVLILSIVVPLVYLLVTRVDLHPDAYYKNISFVPYVK